MLGRQQRKRGLTEEQRQEIKEAFDLFDTEGAGIPSALTFPPLKLIRCHRCQGTKSCHESPWIRAKKRGNQEDDR